MKKLGHRGFTLVEVLLIVIVLSLVTGVGYYVYNANQDDKKDEAPAIAQTVNKEDEKPTEQVKDIGQFLIINELGIKLPIENGDFAYSVSGETATITSKELTKTVENSNCPNGPVTVGKITRTTGNTTTSSITKQLDSFYISLEIGEGGFACDDSGNADKVYASTKANLQKSFTNAETL